MTAAPAIKSRLKFKLKIVAGPHLNEVYSLDHDSLRIGRGEENEIKLANDSRISRNHAEIIWTGSEYRVKNLSQKNFIMVDGVVLEEGPITPTSKLQIGETLFEVFDDGPMLVPSTVESKAPAQKPSGPPVVNQGSPLVPKPNGSPLKPAPTMPNRSQPLGQVRPQPQAQSHHQQPAYRPPQDNGRRNFYLILGGIAALFTWWYLRSSGPKVTKTFRNTTDVEYDLLQSANERKKLEERLQGQQSETAKRAQENLIKGFRDFQQGNFSRARDHFQVVLNLNPDNEIAKRYYHLSRIKFDELLQFHMLQGLRYRDKRNYRMCRSSFQSALVMIQNNSNHPKYREIKGFFDECNLAIEGRF